MLGDLVGIEIGAVGVIVLEAVNEPQHNDHEHVGNQIAHEGDWRGPSECSEQGEANQNHADVARQLVAALGNDEGAEHHNRVHQDAVSGYEAPLEENCDAINERVLFKKSFVIKPHHIVVLDVMPEVFGANVLHRAVAGPADPPEPTG